LLNMVAGLSIRQSRSVGFLLPALDLKGENRRAAIGQILLMQGVVGLIEQRGRGDLVHLRVGSQKFHHFLVFSA
jgi:hypothetical protein